VIDKKYNHIFDISKIDLENYIYTTILDSKKIIIKRLNIALNYLKDND